MNWTLGLLFASCGFFTAGWMLLAAVWVWSILAASKNRDEAEHEAWAEMVAGKHRNVPNSN